MKMLSISILCALCCLLTNSSAAQKVHSTYYSEINYFSLKGVTVLSENNLKYPCYRIDSLDPEKKIVNYLYSADKSVQRSYTRHDGYWMASYIEQADSLSLTKYHYIVDDSDIIWLEYVNDAAGKPIGLRSVALMEYSTVVTFGFEKLVKVEPNFEMGSLLLNKLAYRTVTTYEIRKGLLVKTWSQKNKLTDKTTSGTKTFPLDKHSIYWGIDFLDR